MIILMTHIKDAKPPGAAKHTKAQYAWAMEWTGIDDPDVAISALYRTNINAVVWQGFYLARNTGAKA